MNNQGRHAYEVLTSNCEHFTSWCRLDDWSSNQSDNFFQSFGLEPPVPTAEQSFIHALFDGDEGKQITTQYEETEPEEKQ